MANNRGKKIGSKLLKEICYEADKQKENLHLEIQPSGGLTYDQLSAWYERYGFVNKSGFYTRLPK